MRRLKRRSRIGQVIRGLRFTLVIDNRQRRQVDFNVIYQPPPEQDRRRGQGG